MKNLRQSVVEKIEKNEKLYYLLQCVKNINNKIFVNDVNNLNKSPYFVKFESLGHLNKNKIVYLLQTGDNASGFFSEYRRWLESMYFADRFGFSPTIILDSKSFYAEKDEIFGTSNPFEYYFEQPTEISKESALKSYNVVRFREAHRKICNDGFNHWGYEISDEYVNSMADINRKYLKLNQRVNRKIKSDVSSILNGKKTLGIHVRGTDFKVGYNAHPTFVSPEEYLEKAKEIFENMEFEQIFLATDELRVIELFRQSFEQKLVYYLDVERGSGNTSVALSENTRENHRYLLGYEVLRDMHTLSSCQGLIAGLSAVSLCARIEKRSKEENFEYLQILSKGVLDNNKSCDADMKRKKIKLFQ